MKVEDPYEKDAERALQVGLTESGVRGKPLARRRHGGPPSLESYLRASGGPLPYMTRLRRIEDETARHEHDLVTVRGSLERAYAGDGVGLAQAWQTVLGRWDFSAVNDLIDRHNRWYPIEARLPMDPVTQDYALVRGQPYLRRPLDPRWADDRARAGREAA